jgi:hypothetical protein
MTGEWEGEGSFASSPLLSRRSLAVRRWEESEDDGEREERRAGAGYKNDDGV